MYVARGSDDLWLEVICQSNLEIAGSPRNIFWYRLVIERCGGRVLDECLGRKAKHLTKLRIPQLRARDSVRRS